MTIDQARYLCDCLADALRIDRHYLYIYPETEYMPDDWMAWIEVAGDVWYREATAPRQMAFAF